MAILFLFITLWFRWRVKEIFIVLKISWIIARTCKAITLSLKEAEGIQQQKNLNISFPINRIFIKCFLFTSSSADLLCLFSLGSRIWGSFRGNIFCLQRKISENFSGVVHIWSIEVWMPTTGLIFAVNPGTYGKRAHRNLGSEAETESVCK